MFKLLIFGELVHLCSVRYSPLSQIQRMNELNLQFTCSPLDHDSSAPKHKLVSVLGSNPWKRENETHTATIPDVYCPSTARVQKDRVRIK
jgi:hypothetical protein